ncbi:hypothetical protein [Rhodopila sp.]|jgi:hypothetical protein|uniref:hypothetical protein n=1 Tax=Rhodopila sp. TaxID=2480087 RepID=UPI002C0C2D82|nr:hypothetical protein [Rhodopila sp.]HVZ06984.1 hypothetical protein [Rhodopila sp.]
MTPVRRRLDRRIGIQRPGRRLGPRRRLQALDRMSLLQEMLPAAFQVTLRRADLAVQRDDGRGAFQPHPQRRPLHGGIAHQVEGGEGQRDDAAGMHRLGLGLRDVGGDQVPPQPPRLPPILRAEREIGLDVVGDAGHQVAVQLLEGGRLHGGRPGWTRG